MRPQSIKTRIFCSFYLIILLLGISIFFLGLYVVKNDILGRALNQVEHDLGSARTVFSSEYKSISKYFDIADFNGNLENLKSKLSLDYLYKIDINKANDHRSSVIAKAILQGDCGGARIIEVDELNDIDRGIAENVRVDVVPTQMARKSNIEVIEKAMAIEYAKALKGPSGKITDVVYGGKIINRDFALIDKISDLVFESRLYDSKPVGTVTIFQDDVRISTNVLGNEGKRAVGTRVSEEVYNKVVLEGQKWFGRAFVVTDWYITAYEPIRNVSGEIIGILYVGTLEKPFTHMILKLIIVFLSIGFLAITLGGWLSYMLAEAISRPVKNLLFATKKISSGDLGTASPTNTSIVEFNELADSFNIMSSNLVERDRNLKITNEKLEELNKSYIDLIGFVSHELKGLLASAIMNSYSIRDGYLGMINFKQQRAINSITRNLDYLTATVKKFLNLGRIQKGEMELNRKEINLYSDIFEVSIETFSNQFKMMNIEVINVMDHELVVNADPEMMLIVANNLISNAAKYGLKDGTVLVKSFIEGCMVSVEVYSDARPITEEAKLQLFKKFSRLDVPERRTVKGTGLGLFITKEIIEAHGGTIEVVPKEKGNSFIFHIERGM